MIFTPTSKSPLLIISSSSGWQGSSVRLTLFEDGKYKVLARFAGRPDTERINDGEINKERLNNIKEFANEKLCKNEEILVQDVFNFIEYHHPEKGLFKISNNLDLSNQVVELFPEFKEARDYLSEIAKQDLAKWREEHANLQKQNS